jgi:two-component system CheB/CheR fusion protein
LLTQAHAEGVIGPEQVVLTIIDVTGRELQLRQRSTALAEAETHSREVQRLLGESTRSVRELLQANQELATANAGLRSANEELLVGNEEAQAAMEEIETLNEEQQATNEELETLNEELQATVEELNATNEDLQARTIELQEQAASRESLVATLGEERQRLDAILASMSDAVVLVDTDGEPLLINAAFKQMFGERLPAVEDASGHRLPARGQPTRMSARGETFTMSFTVPGADGSRRWFEATGQPIRFEGVTGGVVVIRDVSERSLRQLEEEFVALASHELRTPLAAVRGSLQMLERLLGDEAAERVRQYLEIGVAHTRLLEDLVRDLADVVRVQSGQIPITRERLNLVDVAQTATDLARPIGDSQEIRLQADGDALSVNGDPRRLQQVLLNLIANAIEHGASGRGVDIRLRREDNTAIVEVSDYGTGIAEEDRARVFERFFQGETNGRGLGVGLYLVHALVAAHDGSVDFQSSDSQGTTFVVRLPLVE